MTDDGKLKARLRKLHELALRGCGGEQVNAQRMLDKLMAKHGITPAELAGEAIETHWFKRPTCRYQRRLMHQVMYQVAPKADKWRHRTKRSLLGIDCTAFEHAQIQLHLQAYAPALEQALGEALSAFYHVNHVFPAESQPSSDDKVPDRDWLRRVGALAVGMQRTTVRTAIEQAK